MEIEIRKVDIKNLADENWDEIFAYRRKMHFEIQPNEPFLEDEVWKKRTILQFEDDTFEFELYQIRAENKTIAVGNIGWLTEKSSGYEENKKVAFTGIEILPEYRRNGIAKKLLKEIADTADKYDKSILVGGTIEDDGKKFIQAIGGKEALSNIDNRLVLSEVDWEMVQEWADTGKSRNQEVEIVELEIVPDDMMEAFVTAFDATLRQVPTEELDMVMTVNAEEVRKSEEKRKKTGQKQIKLVTVEPDGAISGLTWLTYDPDVKTALYQGMTGVMEEYRGRGLGKWLKSEALLLAKERYPDAKYIKTDNADSNAPMRSINERLGFREFRRTYNLQVELDTLKEYLGRN